MSKHIKDHTGTTLTLTIDGVSSQWKSPACDETLETVLNGFYGLCVSQTWAPESVLQAFSDFVSNRLNSD